MEIKRFEYKNCLAYLNCQNGKIIYADREISEEKLKSYPGFNSIFTMPRFLSKYSVFYLGFDLSGKCNLACRYCFRNKNGEKTVNVNFIERTIRSFLSANKLCKRLFVDLSGSSEPLIAIDKILEVADICAKIKEETKIDIVINFICNGTLLDETAVSKLQSHNMLFGVSFDANSNIGDPSRCFPDGRDSRETVIENINKIKDKHLLGVSMTLDNRFSGDLFESYMLLSKLAPTFSIRLCRNENLTYEENVLNDIKDGYSKVAKYISETVNNNDFKFIFGFLNGDDSFAKIFVRVFSDLATSYPCEGLIGRFFFNGENVYPCAPAASSKLFEANSANESNKEFSLYSYSDVICHDCFARRFCGGECPLVLKKEGVRDAFNCELRKYFVELSIQIIIDIMDNKDYYKKVAELVWARIKRNAVE